MDAFNYATQVEFSFCRKPKKSRIIANFDLCEMYLKLFLGESECKNISSISFVGSNENKNNRECEATVMRIEYIRHHVETCMAVCV